MAESNVTRENQTEELTDKDVVKPVIVQPRTQAESTGAFKVYPRRWAVLFTVTCLNISNAAIWICISPVATRVAEYYEKDLADINWFSLVFLFVSIPFCFISTFSVNRLGLKPAIHIGAALNCIGAIVRALGTSGIFSDLNTQFAVSLTGQVIAAMAQSFLLFIPTKVSQLWFPDNARAVSTTILSLSNPLGIVVAMVVSPLTVNKKEDFPLLNWIFMGVAVVAEVITIICVTRSKPVTPPSASAEEGNDQTTNASYLSQLKDAFTSVPYWLLLLALGCGVGLFSALATVTQQILCPLGYSDDFVGLANATMILCGFVGSAVTGVLVDKTKQFTPITKICYGIAAIMSVIMLEMFMVPHQPAVIATFTGLFGFFGIGAYPIGLELAVEATYPVDQTISTAFIFMSGQLQGVVIIALTGFLARPQKSQYIDIQVCTKSDISHIEPKDYTVSLMAIMSLLVLMVILTIIFMETPYKRLEAERAAMKRKASLGSGLASPSSSSFLEGGEEEEEEEKVECDEDDDRGSRKSPSKFANGGSPSVKDGDPEICQKEIVEEK
ncbi:solute carrier family 49 member A3-like isoform X2 [Palaemon carinicauda]|uniref:solute carrier family 49 member A3-like isoform X2 n=1 Tax=Palaemon carinicauda TaxID=392227 RepID=UPI0035B594DB